MATITRGPKDVLVKKIQHVLDAYEEQHPGAVANVYRQNSGSVRIRIVDARFAKWSKGRRHDHVFKFIATRLDEDDIQEISVLLLLSPAEKPSSFLNEEFESPTRSKI